MRACTCFVLKAADGAAVYGRTMEWGAFDLNSRVVIIPREQEMFGHLPDGKTGLRWKAKYGVVALDALEKDILTDGMNESGLVVGVLYHPGFAQYQEYDPGQRDRTMGATDLAANILTQFASVDEVRRALNEIIVVPIPVG
jgi:choloylglycine hydrolase